MQCVAITTRGARCRREAAPNSETCYSHRPKPERAGPTKPSRARPFYAPKFPPESRKAIAQAAHLEGIGEEIAVLRTVIRDAAVAGNFAEARHGIADLSRILHRHQTAGAAADQLATWIEEALDILDAEGPTP